MSSLALCFMKTNLEDDTLTSNNSCSAQLPTGEKKMVFHPHELIIYLTMIVLWH